MHRPARISRPQVIALPRPSPAVAWEWFAVAVAVAVLFTGLLGL